jgi:hypothetical protein
VAAPSGADTLLVTAAGVTVAAGTGCGAGCTCRIWATAKGTVVNKISLTDFLKSSIQTFLITKTERHRIACFLPFSLVPSKKANYQLLAFNRYFQISWRRFLLKNH